MGKEIERKFLVDVAKLKEDPNPRTERSHLLEQFYLSNDPWVRVRLVTQIRGRTEPPFIAYLTIKGPGNLSRDEFEYTIPVDDAIAMREMGKGVIEKVRYHVPFGGHTWDVDYFQKPFDNFWLAEVELKSVEEPFEKPPWALEEVSYDFRYSNAWLIKHGPPPPGSSLKDIEKLVRWRENTSDYSGDDLRSIVRHDLTRPNDRVPDELKSTHEAFLKMGDDAQEALIEALIPGDSYEYEGEEPDDDDA